MDNIPLKEYLLKRSKNLFDGELDNFIYDIFRDVYVPKYNENRFNYMELS